MSPPEQVATAPGRCAADIRNWIVNELARSLNVEPSSIDSAAPLDTLGVDSLAAIGMTGGLAGWLKRDLPTTLMWDYASIDAIAAGLADPQAQAKSQERPGVVDLQPHGDRLPLFFFPGMGGHPVSFAPMASLLKSTPCYGLTVPALYTDSDAFTPVEKIAATMLENLRRVQPVGPYQLAGYSFGGLLAYETAQQLTAMGEAVCTLAMYDTFTANGRVLRPRWQRWGLHAYQLASQPGRVAYLRERFRRSRVSQPAPSLASDSATEAQAAKAKAISGANKKASVTYQPKPYPGSMLLFRATSRATHSIFYKMDPQCGWGTLVTGGLRTIDLPGTHLGILSADSAPAAAESLRPFLRD